MCIDGGIEAYEKVEGGIIGVARERGIAWERGIARERGVARERGQGERVISEDMTA